MRNKVSLGVGVGAILFVLLDLSQLEQNGVVVYIRHKASQPNSHTNPKLRICRIAMSSNPNAICVAIQNVEHNGGKERQDVDGRHRGSSKRIDDTAIDVVGDPRSRKHHLEGGACGPSKQQRAAKHDGRNHLHQGPAPFARQAPVDAQLAGKST